MKSILKMQTENLGTKQVIACASGVKYKLRAECRNDCEHVKAVLRPWLQMWQETSGWEPWSGESVPPAGDSWNWNLDTDVEFTLKEDGPTLGEVRWLINAIADCHVAAETVERLESYTGERLYHRLECELVTPCKEVIKASMAAVKRMEALYDLNEGTAKETFEKLNDELRRKKSEVKPRISIAEFNARIYERRIAEAISGIEKRARKKIDKLRA